MRNQQRFQNGDLYKPLLVERLLERITRKELKPEELLEPQHICQVVANLYFKCQSNIRKRCEKQGDLFRPQMMVPIGPGSITKFGTGGILTATGYQKETIKKIKGAGKIIDRAGQVSEHCNLLIIREATALNVLLGHVAEVKAQAEDTILVANRRIGEEIKKLPKAKPGPSPKELLTPRGKQFGRKDVMPGTSRARLRKLAAIPVAEIKATSKQLREHGKDATVKAVVTALTQGDKKQARAAREKQLGEKQRASCHSGSATMTPYCLFGNVPKIELNRRGAPRAGWDAWGFEAQAAEAAE
jgi:hypothetical protein